MRTQRAGIPASLTFVFSLIHSISLLDKADGKISSGEFGQIAAIFMREMFSEIIFLVE